LNLQLQNKCLLAKWLVNLLNTEGTWQSLLRNKYCRTKTLTQVSSKPNDSHFWRGLMRVKDEVLSNGSFVIKDGTNTRFWDDTWIGDKPLKDTYPSQGRSWVLRGPGQNLIKGPLFKRISMHSEDRRRMYYWIYYCCLLVSFLS
jgi:hypothetical protein